MHEASRWLADLCALGLTQYEAKVYLALIRRQSSTAAEAARAALVPRQRIYDVLASLFERGLVLTRPGRSTRYAAIEPKQAMDRLITERREVLTGLERSATDLVRDLAPSWSSGRDHADPLDFLTVLRDVATRDERRDELRREARDRLLIMDKLPRPEGLPPGPIAPVRDLRAVYQRRMYDLPGVREELDDLVARGGQVRLSDDVPMRLCLADDARVLMSLTDPLAEADSITTMLVEHAELARSLSHTFDNVWARAEPGPG